jgi:hypothetical protein
MADFYVSRFSYRLSLLSGERESRRYESARPRQAAGPRARQGVQILPAL